MSAMRTIILLGELARKYGREHRLAVLNTAEAIRALCANFPDLRRHMASAHERGVAYRVIVDASPIPDETHLNDPVAATVKIVPVPIGAKSAGLGIILGTALMVASSFMTGGLASPLFTVGTFAPSIASITFGIGAMIALSGVSALLAKTTAATDDSNEENKPSYNFGGAVNTTQQGNCVPLGYGRLVVGSQVISSGIAADDYVE